MTRRMTVTLAALLVTAVAVHAQGGWVTLLDGTTLKGWNQVGDANWEIVDGAAQATKGMNSCLVTPQPYGDFQLTAEVFVAAKGNSGIFIRCQDPKDIQATNCYEVNLYDTRPDPSYRTGAIVNVSKPMATVNADGKWTSVDITARGTKLIVVMDGIKTVDVDHKQHARGVIALQYGQGAEVVKFRNVRIRAL